MSTDKRVKTLAVSEETHQELITLKLKMRARTVDEVIRFLLERYSQSEQKEVKRSEEEIAKIASDLIYKVCVDLGKDAKFLPPFIYKRYKIKDKDIVEYFDRIRDKEIDCSKVLESGYLIFYY